MSRLLAAAMLVAGCTTEDAPQPPKKLSDSALLRSIDFENPQVEDAPKLIELFEQHSLEICNRAVDALEEIGEPAIPYLVDKLRPEEDLWVQSRVKAALIRIGPAAIPALARAVDEGGYDRISLAAALGEIYPTTDDAVQALRRCLNYPSARLTALYSLQRLKGDAKSAVPDIIPLLRHEDLKIRREAAHALYEIDFEAAYKAGVRKRGIPPE